MADRDARLRTVERSGDVADPKAGGVRIVDGLATAASSRARDARSSLSPARPRSGPRAMVLAGARPPPEVQAGSGIGAAPLEFELPACVM
jgi:hypothetical protein